MRTSHIARVFGGILALGLLAGCAGEPPRPAVGASVAPTKTATDSKGAYLTDLAGKALYTFDKDGPTTIACLAKCLNAWPVMVPAATEFGSGDYTVLKRPDGFRQWAYKGKALYTYAKDEKPGDTTGDNFKDVWHLARP